MSEVIDISPGNLDSSLCFLQRSVSHDVLCIEVTESCPTLGDPIDGSPPGSPVPGILQARTLEWVTISFSNAWKWKVKVKSLSPVWLFATPSTAAYQAPPSTGFSRHEYWSGVPSPSPNVYMTFRQVTSQCELLISKNKKDRLKRLYGSMYFLQDTFTATYTLGFPGGSAVRNLLTNVGDPEDGGSIPESGRSSGEGSGNTLQYSCLGNSMDRGAW